MGICDGRVVVITGAGRGIGREHALEFASQGAKLVINDLGAEVDGSGSSDGPAGQVVDEIRGMGGEAVANGDDVSDYEGAGRLIQTAIDTFGTIDVLVNNAGILRDRMLVNMTIDEWDAVIKVHLRGTFAPTRHAVEYWRNRTKAGETNDARIINTTSPSGIYGNVGQTNYGAAKAGIASFTIIAAMELERYGVTVNAIAPAALTRMTENLGGGFTRPRRSPRSSTPSTRPTSRRSSCGSAAPSRRASPAASSTCRATTSAWPRAGWKVRPPTRATAGTRPSSARSCPTWWPRRRRTPTWAGSGSSLGP